MTTISEAITSAGERGKGALVGYLPLGYPDLQGSIEAAVTLAENGFDLIELGIPYSDPVMDGPVIQRAAQQALEQGFRLSDVFEATAAIRARTDIPLLVMSYWNPLFQFGIDSFAEQFKAAGGNGIITPDLIPDEAAEWITAAKKHGLDRIFLASPTSSDERLRLIQEAASGFVYVVSTMGVTGLRQEVDAAAKTLTERLRQAGDNCLGVGIGISDARQVAEVLEYADAAIVGSVLVKALAEGGLDSLAAKAADLASGKTR